MKLIPLKMKGGYTYALVDDDDYERLNQYKWRVDGTGYATRRSGRIYMHREIVGAASGQEVDHRNLQKRDNQRSNLRLATRSQQGHNKPKRKGPASSRYIGVSYQRPTLSRPWQARISVDGRHEFLGSFATQAEAALAYNAAALKYHGEFACLNEIKES